MSQFLFFNVMLRINSLNFAFDKWYKNIWLLVERDFYVGNSLRFLLRFFWGTHFVFGIPFGDILRFCAAILYIALAAP